MAIKVAFDNVFLSFMMLPNDRYQMVLEIMDYENYSFKIKMQ